MEDIEPTSRVFVTCNSEYGLRDQRVVAVRRRGEAGWLPSHRALGMRVVSDPKTVVVGDCLLLAGGHETLTTSMVVGMRRGTIASPETKHSETKHSETKHSETKH